MWTSRRTPKHDQRAVAADVTGAWGWMKEIHGYAAGTGALQPGRGEEALLVVAHPGHELRLFGWLCSARPDVLVLTDGSGHSGRSRIEATRNILRMTGARAGPVFGEFTDRQLYVALLQADAAPFAGLTEAVAAVLRTGRYRTVIADPLEGYNPTHDLCRVIVNTAVRCVSCTSGTLIRNYEYALTGTADIRASRSAIAMRVPPEVRARKIAAAGGYPSRMPRSYEYFRPGRDRSCDPSILWSQRAVRETVDARGSGARRRAAADQLCRYAAVRRPAAASRQTATRIGVQQLCS
jgi:hypothetical protein